MKNHWNQSPQNWNAYGLAWEFTYDELTAKRTITAPGFNLDIKVSDTTKFPSPHLWLGAWAKKNQKKLPSQEQETVEMKLDLFSSPEPSPKSVKAEVVKEELTETEELTDEEQSDRLHLERKVERAFYEAGRALRELRDRRLYRSTHKSFEEYVQDRFCMKRAHSYRLMEASLVVENLSPQCLQIGDILPTNEAQCRPLTKLEPEKQVEAWTKAVESAGGKVYSQRYSANN